MPLLLSLSPLSSCLFSPVLPSQRTGKTIALYDEKMKLLQEEIKEKDLKLSEYETEFAGLKNQQIQDAFSTFQGIKRRMEVKGIAGGVTVVDDFGHHPTAIKETVRALRVKYPDRRLWAIFEPRSNTTRRNVFQTEMFEALALADAIVVSEVARLDLLAVHERMDPVKLMADLQATGKPAAYLPTVEAIVEHVGQQAKSGDVVCVFSNGGFGGIHDKLLQRLGK